MYLKDREDPYITNEFFSDEHRALARPSKRNLSTKGKNKWIGKHKKIL